jgi:catechol 2,3-dioxygenase-like lactoylglutathione lyase family enzyme
MSLSEAQVRATVAVSDMRVATEFYEAVLGLTPLDGNAGMESVRIYRCGEGSLLQVYASQHAGSATATVASWSTADFESVLEELRSRGVLFEASEAPEADQRGIHTFGAHKVAWLKDPDGNTIAIDNGEGPS